MAAAVALSRTRPERVARTGPPPAAGRRSRCAGASRTFGRRVELFALMVAGPHADRPLPRCKRRANLRLAVSASGAPDRRDAVTFDLAVESIATDAELRRDTAHVAVQLFHRAQQRGALGGLQTIPWRRLTRLIRHCGQGWA